MSNTLDVMAYLIKNYPERMSDELSNARLTKMVYLADWRHVLETGKQITPIKWYFDNYGPFVRDVEHTALLNEDVIAVEKTTNMYGQSKKKFALKDPGYSPTLREDEIQSLDHIINVTSKLYWKDFINLVYSTHPIASSERYSYLDLATKAKEYQAVLAETKS